MKKSNTSKYEYVHITYEQKIKPYHKEIAKLINSNTIDNPKILDIGVGVGHLLTEIRKNHPNADITGADIDEKCLSITNKKIGLSKKMKINDVSDLFNCEEKYDVIIFSHTLEHVLRPYDTVVELLKLLNPNGFMAIAVPNPARPDVFLFNLLRYNYVNRGHVQAWDRSHWKNFLEVIVGAEVITYGQDYIRVPYLDRFTLLEPIFVFMAKIMPWLAYSNIALVRPSRND